MTVSTVKVILEKASPCKWSKLSVVCLPASSQKAGLGWQQPRWGWCIIQESHTTDCHTVLLHSFT